jgi:hypothetical protein
MTIELAQHLIASAEANIAYAKELIKSAPSMTSKNYKIGTSMLESQTRIRNNMVRFIESAN